MNRLHPNTILGTFAILFAVVLILVWIPLDSETGLVEVRRRKMIVGDGLAPTVAGFFFLFSGVLLLFGAREQDAPRITRKELGFVLAAVVIVALGILVIRFAGPLVAWISAVDYRPLRGTAPWKYIGFVLGGAWMVGALICFVEGRVTWQAVLIALGAVIALIVLYDLPFEDLLLPPNGDM